MGALALAVILAVSAGLSGLVTRAGVEPWSGVNAEVVNADHSREWVLSNGTLPIGKDRAIGLKLDRYRVMWLGGDADDPADNNRCFIYDIRSRTFRETAPIPSAKSIDANSAAGVLPDGTVVVAGGFPSDDGLGDNSCPTVTTPVATAGPEPAICPNRRGGSSRQPTSCGTDGC